MRWVATYLNEREQTIRVALGGNDTTGRYVVIMVTQAVILGALIVLALGGFVISRLV
jgi:hypothetical protein